MDRLVEEHRQPQHDVEIMEQATLADFDSALVSGFLAREKGSRAQFRLVDSATLVGPIPQMVEDSWLRDLSLANRLGQFLLVGTPASLLKSE